MEKEKAAARLEAMCAASERCSWELLQKLRLWGVSRDDAQEIVDGLVERQFVDDERFARAFVRDRYRFARWGRVKIRAALLAKRVPSWMIDEALTEVDEELYLEALYRLLSAKIGSLKDEAFTYEGRTKLFRYAASRGYEPGIVADAIRSDELWAPFRPEDAEDD